MNRDRQRRVSKSFELNGTQEAKYWVRRMSKDESRSLESSMTTAALTAARMTGGPNDTSRSLWTSESARTTALPKGLPKTVRSIEQPGASTQMWNTAKRNLKFK
eukprot:m.455906 g.455906  ORF g.455906 m.455906 type:complete len:104 (-) comp20959_c0_seq1:262-573(-)